MELKPGMRVKDSRDNEYIIMGRGKHWVVCWTEEKGEDYAEADGFGGSYSCDDEIIRRFVLDYPFAEKYKRSGYFVEIRNDAEYAETLTFVSLEVSTDSIAMYLLGDCPLECLVDANHSAEQETDGGAVNPH